MLLSCVCPCVGGDVWFIHRGGIVSKCPLDFYENIIGFLDKRKFQILSKRDDMVQLKAKCYECRFLYVCMGKNCSYCNHGEFTCQPRYGYMKSILTNLLV